MLMNNFQIYVLDNRKLQKLPNCNKIISEMNGYCITTYSNYYYNKILIITIKDIEEIHIVLFKNLS